MSAEARPCPYCRKPFVPSPFHPRQRVCSSPGCQLRRRTDYHRHKYRCDPDYRQVCRDSDAKWRCQNAGYQRQYRDDHPDYVDRNRHSQTRRDRKRRMRRLVKNNVALDVKASSADVWLVGPELGDLVKNNVAIREVMIFQTVAASGIRPGRSCKEHPSVPEEGLGL
jgi:hypothetical protein